MNKVILLAMFLFLGCSNTLFAQQQKGKKAEELNWLTDVNKAQELSKKTKKPIFAFFTGSDWCGWCKKLQADVFAKPEFVTWANKNVILLELDFPRRKQLAPELQKQNSELQQAFQVGGFPTIWMFYLLEDEKEKKKNISALGSLGYPSGATPGKEEVTFLATANSILKNKK